MTKDIAPIGPRIPGKTSAHQMLWLADAYAEAAKVLSDSLVSDDFTRQYSSTRVIIHLCRHATELYLKGAIGAKTGRVAPKTHRLDQLYKQYISLYPHNHHQFEVPFSRQILTGDDGLFPGTLEEYQKTHDQRFRYPVDNSGKSFLEFDKFDVIAYAESVAEFRQIINLLVARIEWPAGFGDAAT
jgi:hypothetical protein